MIATWQRARELRGLLDELAPGAWRFDPGWWTLVGLAAVVEPLGRRAGGPYLTSNAEPSHDTFMATAGPGPDGPAAWIAWAVTAAHAAVAAIRAHDGTLPDQPLAVTVDVRHGIARSTAVDDLHRVGFVVGDRLWIGQLDARGPGHDADLARALARTVRGRPSQLTSGGPPPAVVVALGDDALDRAHHGHRRGWTPTGGPWLGVARAGGLTVVSTCHLVVDGFGHALLTRAIVDAPPVPALHAAAAAALARLAADPAAPIAADAPLPAVAPLAASAGATLDLAWRRVEPLPGFAPLAYALGQVLHRSRGDARARRSPSFQVPVAPGAVDDPDRFRRRVRPALLSVRFADGRPEPLPAFAARAKLCIAREADRGGLASRLLASLAAIPLPIAFKRQALVRPPSRLLAGPTELLAGDGCLSLLRLPGAAALIAASAPPPQIPRTRSASVLTVVRDATGATVTLAAVGPTPAAELLDQWLAVVARG